MTTFDHQLSGSSTALGMARTFKALRQRSAFFFVRWSVSFPTARHGFPPLLSLEAELLIIGRNRALNLIDFRPVRTITGGQRMGSCGTLMDVFCIISPAFPHFQGSGSNSKLSQVPRHTGANSRLFREKQVLQECVVSQPAS